MEHLLENTQSNLEDDWDRERDEHQICEDVADADHIQLDDCLRTVSWIRHDLPV